MTSDPSSQPEPPADPIVPTPLPPTSPEVSATTPLPPGTLSTTDTGLPPNVAAGLAVLLTFISGLIFLFIEKRNPFVRFWAMQAVFVGVAWFASSIVIAVVGVMLGFVLGPLATLWFLMGKLVYLGFVVIWIIMLIQTFSGKEWTVPILGPMARRQLTKPPVL